MKSKLLILTLVCAIMSLSCIEQKTYEIPLTEKDGYGNLYSSFSGVALYSDDEGNPWKKTYLNLSGIPDDWTDVKVGDVETDIYQKVYQNYLVGNVTEERYEELQEAWDWVPDTTKLSKAPLKTQIAFVYGIDSTGVMKMKIDTNNNHDFSDDESFSPFEMSPNESVNMDSVALAKSISVTYEQSIDNEIVERTSPLLVAYMASYQMIVVNFPQHMVGSFNGEKIVVDSDGFANLSYKNPNIAILCDTLKEGDKINNEYLVAKNELIEIKGNFYNNIGVDLSKNSLILEKVNQPKHKIYSTQIGFKAHPFEGTDFVSDLNISLDELKGKYVYLDFWAVWCGPCRYELPYLRELYAKTDRDKFEIVGVVCDSSSDALRDIINNDSISWPQIISDSDNELKSLYSIKGYPTTFLISPDGIIINKYLRGQEMVDTILELLNE